MQPKTILRTNTKTMTKQTWFRYKQKHNTIPRCIMLGCRTPILIGQKYQRVSNYGHTRYLCEPCTKRNLVIYLLPFRGKKH